MKVGEDSEYSVLAKVELKKLFHNNKVRQKKDEPSLICLTVFNKNNCCSVLFVCTDKPSDGDKSIREPREGGDGEKTANLESRRLGRGGSEERRSGGCGEASG